MEAGGCLRAWRKRSDKLVELDQVASISGDNWRGRSRRLVEHDQANGDTRPGPAKHLLQANIEQQRCFVLCLGEGGSIEAFGHDRDNPRPIGSGPDCTAQVALRRLAVLAAFLAAGERRVHQHDRRNRATMQVGDQFPVMRSDRGRREDVGQAVSSCRIDLVEEQRSVLDAAPKSKGAIACGRFEERVVRRDSCGLCHQPGQHRRGRELLELDLSFAAHVPGRQGCFEPVEPRFGFVHACRQIDARGLAKPEQCADLDRVVVVVDRPGASPVQCAGLFGEQPGNVGTGKMTSRGEKLGNPGANSVSQWH